MDDVGAWLTVLLVLFLFGIMVLSPFVKYSTTRDGEHRGYVTAVEQGGFFFHNYTVYFKTDNSSSQEDNYCVQESERGLAAQLKEANQNRELVTIHYEGVRGIGLALCTGEKIVRVEK